jgi:hypothetical protein
MAVHRKPPRSHIEWRSHSSTRSFFAQRGWPAAFVLALLAASGAAHAAPSNEPETVGGGALGVPPGPVGPPDRPGLECRQRAAPRQLQGGP